MKPVIRPSLFPRFGANPTGQRKYRKMRRIAARQGGLQGCGGWMAPCCYCRWWFPLLLLTFEHLTNRSEGGTWHDDNLALACRPCNAYRSHVEARRQHPWPGISGYRERKRIASWVGLRLFYVEPDPTWRLATLPSVKPSRREVLAAHLERQRPFRERAVGTAAPPVADPPSARPASAAAADPPKRRRPAGLGSMADAFLLAYQAAAARAPRSSP